MKVIVSVDFSEVRRVDIAQTKIGIGESHLILIHAPAAASRLETEIAPVVRLGITNGHRADTALGVWNIDPAAVPHADEASRQTRLACGVRSQLWKRHIRFFHVATQQFTAVGSPRVHPPVAHASHTETTWLR